MTNITKYFAFMIITTLMFSACTKEPHHHDEVELITTLNYTLTPSTGGTAITLSFEDIDGDGGNAPIVTGGTLAANQSYMGTLELLNASVSPAENITEEIEEEDEEHQFFFQSTIAGLSIAYDDENLDANGNPVGLHNTLKTGDAASGSITIVLRHEPNKSDSGVSDGDITNAGGETDIEVTFPIDVK